MMIFNHVAKWVNPLLPTIKQGLETALDMKMIVLFRKYQEFMNQGLSFVWGGSDLASAGIFSDRTWTQIFADLKCSRSVFTAILMVASGVLGIIVAYKTHHGIEKTIALAAMDSVSHFFFLWSNIIYLFSNIERWQNAESTNNEKEGWISSIGIFNNLGYIIVSFFGVFGTFTATLTAITLLTLMAGGLKILCESFL